MHLPNKFSQCVRQISVLAYRRTFQICTTRCTITIMSRTDTAHFTLYCLSSISINTRRFSLFMLLLPIIQVFFTAYGVTRADENSWVRYRSHFHINLGYFKPTQMMTLFLDNHISLIKWALKG